MPRFTKTAFSPIEMVGAAFSTPLVSLAIALMVAVVIIAFSSSRSGHASMSESAVRPVRARYLPERRTLGIAAIAVVVVFVAENVVRGYLLNLIDVVAWWRFATPVACSFLTIAVLLVLIEVRGSAPEAPVVTGARRGWMSFGPRGGLIAGCVALLLLVGTTIAAGFASAADGRGRHIWLEIPIPNEADIDPLRLTFYGWAFGVPVLIALAALVPACWAALHANASRPYIRPETVTGERALRREVASASVRIATAGMLLTLAGGWRLIASAGSGSQLWIDGQNAGLPYEAVWRYAELAAVAGWLAPALEIIAFVQLLLVAGLLRGGAPGFVYDSKTEQLVESAAAGR